MLQFETRISAKTRIIGLAPRDPHFGGRYGAAKKRRAAHERVLALAPVHENKCHRPIKHT